MEKNFLDLAKEINNATGGSIETALNLLHTMTDDFNFNRWISNNDSNFNHSDYVTENRAVNAVIDYFIEMNGNINIKELIKEILDQLTRGSEDKIKEMSKVFHNIEDNKRKIFILKNFNNLNLFKQENNKSYIDLIKEYPDIDVVQKDKLEWNAQSEYNLSILNYKFLGENKTCETLLGKKTTNNFDETFKRMKVEVLCFYKYVFENFPYLLTEFKTSSICVTYDFYAKGITKEQLLAMYLEEGTMFELIKYKKKYYDSIGKKYPTVEGKSIYIANMHNLGDNKEEIDRFLEESFDMKKIRTLVKKATTNKEI